MDSHKKQRLDVKTRHLERLDQWQKRLAALDQRFFVTRLATLTAGGLAVFLAFFFGSGRLGLAALGALVAAFSVVVFFHRRLDRSRLRFRLVHAHAAAQLARMRLDWEALPPPVAITVGANHPFAADLNLVGERSLHQLVDTATSQGGAQKLAGWLLDPWLEARAIEHRQAILQEMIPRSGFRDRLALNGLLAREEAQQRWSGEKLLGWLKKRSAGRSLAPVLAVLLALSAINVVFYTLNALGSAPAWWTISLTLYAGIYLFKYRDYETLFEDTYLIGKHLDKLRSILVYLEEYPYPQGSRFARLAEPFWKAQQKPSAFLKKIVWITSAASLGNNQFLSLFFNAVLPWNLLFAHILNGYKAELERSLEGWLETWYELEALNSLANFAYLNPAYTFPEVQELGRTDRPVLAAQQIGHPLLPDEARVCNDFITRSLGDITIITGSNMSGKSTFLRTLGVNLCLAYAGSVVAAERLETILFRVFTTITVSDSLSYGISYFYAEVRRLKALLEEVREAGGKPVFFLIDEIFRGTNNQERRIGSQAYVRALAHGNGAGVISTHDLELARLEEAGKGIRNAHFREEVRDGRMLFDYRLRPGPSPTTNALRIMEMEGLPVRLEED